MKLGHVLITGGSGFIGSHLVPIMLENSSSVTVVDLEPSCNPETNHLIADIRDRDNLEKVISRDIDIIFHLAARTSVLQSMNDPHGVFETNVVGTQNLLELARIRKCTRILIASTNAVVGNNAGEEIRESSTLKPLTPYGSTKAAGEMLANAYSSSYGISSAFLRLTNVYGEGMAKKDSIVPRLMRSALQKTTFSIYGDGEQFRDYVNVDDVAGAFLELAKNSYNGPIVIGTGKSVSVNTLVKMVSETTGVKINVERVPPKSGEMRGVRVDNSLATSLGVNFAVDLREGLAATWTDFLRQDRAKT